MTRKPPEEQIIVCCGCSSVWSIKRQENTIISDLMECPICLRDLECLPDDN